MKEHTKAIVLKTKERVSVFTSLVDTKRKAVESFTLQAMDNLRRVRTELETAVSVEFRKIEQSENRFIEEFIGFLESPLDKNCIVHSEPQAFLESYELYVQEYFVRKNKAAHAK